LLDRTST